MKMTDAVRLQKRSPARGSSADTLRTRRPQAPAEGMCCLAAGAEAAEKRQERAAPPHDGRATSRSQPARAAELCTRRERELG